MRYNLSHAAIFFKMYRIDDKKNGKNSNLFPSSFS